MKIALIGYGKMGKAIEAIALERGHEIVAKISSSHPIESCDLSLADVAIEFSTPNLAVKHMNHCFEIGLPIVVGTTAWNDSLPMIEKTVQEKNASLLYASNFSIGVNLFFELNRKLAQLIAPYKDYTASIEEIHHLQKLDAPSGTALTLASDLMKNNSKYQSWILGEENQPYTNESELGITSYRKPDIPGTHIIKYHSEIDSITISHEAHNRKGFALGAVIASEWIGNKKGIFTMQNVLNLSI